MSPKPTSLMTQYANGQLMTQELQQMMVDYNADSRFDRELHDDIDTWSDTRAAKYGDKLKNFPMSHLESDNE